jgi:long-chain acyl-CoA synthetase
MTITRDEALRQLTAPGQVWELTELTQYGRRMRGFANAPDSLRDLFEAARSDETFVVYEDERLSFEETWQQAARLAQLFATECGVGKGDRVAISMRNYPEWVAGFMAATSLGAIAVAMNALWTPEEMAYGLRDSAPKVLLADRERIERFARCDEVPAGLRVFAVRTEGDLPAGVEGLPTALEAIAQDVAMPAAEIAPEDDATILYTSGSTGHPKGAVSSHRGILSALLSWELDLAAGAMVLGIEPPAPEFQPATLLAVPLFHATGSHAVFLSSYRTQRKLVAMYKWDVARAADLLATLASVGGGGAPRTPDQVARIEKTFENALPNTGWGMTETNAIGSGIGGQDYLDHPASSGRASAVLDLRVVDEEGNVLPAGERGELQVFGVSLIRGYWNREDANAETFVDGWLRTGDVAYLDDEGYLYIVDRIKDLVIRGGENIGCGAVEAAIATYPGVVEVSVYGVPDERLGEEVGATVCVEHDVDEAQLRAHLADHLAKFEIPRYLAFTREPLPRTASGKILKRQLRDEAAARRA